MNTRTFIPVGQDLPQPLIPYSFRAECIADLTKFLDLVCKNAVETERNISALFVETDLRFFESLVEFQSNISLSELQNMLRTIDDSHVILQTLRALPASQNSFERDRNIN